MAASFWSRELLLPLGIDLPIYAMEHHEIITDEIPLLRELGRKCRQYATRGRLPMSGRSNSACLRHL